LSATFKEFAEQQVYGHAIMGKPINLDEVIPKAFEQEILEGLIKKVPSHSSQHSFFRMSFSF
jgi:hypothetical protein